MGFGIEPAIARYIGFPLPPWKAANSRLSFGATALSAVFGNDAVHQLGFRYILCPVLVGSIVLLLLAWS
jgi:hypothetical protein